MKRSRYRWLRLRTNALITLWVMLPALAPSHAQSARATAVIDAGVGRATGGRIAINQAAGIGNAQINLAGIALSERGSAHVQLHATQATPTLASRNTPALARIGTQAFANTDGVLSLNQSAGYANRQRNLIAIGVSTDIGAADDAALAGTTGAAIEPGTTTVSPLHRQAVIADGAFEGSRGVVQVNQTAGVGNSTTNALVLQLPGGTP